jgi:hypothetical protein
MPWKRFFFKEIIIKMPIYVKRGCPMSWSLWNLRLCAEANFEECQSDSFVFFLFSTACFFLEYGKMNEQFVSLLWFWFFVLHFSTQLYLLLFLFLNVKIQLYWLFFLIYIKVQSFFLQIKMWLQIMGHR